jgi:integrase
LNLLTYRLLGKINMSEITFTATRIAAFRCRDGKKQDYQWDTDTQGLGQCVSKTSSSYVYQGRLNGKTLRVVIGKTETWRLSDARTEAKRLQVMVDTGIDPRKVKADALAADQAARDKQQRLTARESVTLGDVWPIYLADRKPKWSDGHYQNHVNLAAPGGVVKKRGKGLTVSGPLAPLMPILLSALTGDTVAEWLTKETTERATNAAQSYRILRALIRWTDDTPAYRGIIPTDAYSARKVRDSVPKNETKEGDSLQREQLPLWFTAIKQISNPVISTYLQGLLITGARRKELAALRWTDVDFQWGKMDISDKVEGARTIPLTPYLSGLLTALPRLNEWVFSSPIAASGHLEAPTKAHQKALAAAGLPHVSIHGLRRSFGTLAEWVEVPTGVAAQIMGHKPSALAEKHYRRRSLDMLRMHHVKIENWILEQANAATLP